MGAVDYIDPQAVSTGRRPSWRQVYAIAGLALQALGREWPESRRQATELINELRFEPVMRALEEAGSEWVETS